MVLAESIKVVQELTVEQIEQRIAEIAEEDKTLRVLLRSAHARRRGAHLREEAAKRRQASAANSPALRIHQGSGSEE
jgi:hypothetical protein